MSKKITKFKLRLYATNINIIFQFIVALCKKNRLKHV